VDKVKSEEGMVAKLWKKAVKNVDRAM